MTLDDFILRYPGGEAAFAEAVGRSRSRVNRWRHRHGSPDAEAIAAIFAVTKGAVKPADLLPGTSPRPVTKPRRAPSPTPARGVAA